MERKKIISFYFTLFQALILIVVLFMPPVVANVILIAMCGWVFRGRVSVIQSISLMVVIKSLNPALFHQPQYFGILCWLVVVCAVLRIIPTISFSQIKLVLPLLFFSLLVGMLSIFSSSQVLVSLMKNLSFTVVAATVLIAYGSMERVEIDSLVRWFVSLYLVVLVLSLPTLFIHPIGYFCNDYGFQGILNQPQTMGVFCTPLFAWNLVSFVDERKDSVAIHCLFLILIGLFLVLTKSRTAVIAAFMGALVAVLIGFCRGQVFVWLSVKRSMLIGGVVLLLLFGVFVLPQIRGAVLNFAHKGGEAKESVQQAFHHSRGRMIEFQWQNFLQKPLTGHGFGVYASGKFPSGVKTFMGVPISASVEKGIMFTALLEETGVLGSIAFLILLMTMIRVVVNTNEYQWVAMFFSCFFINFGEAVFFSMGGDGLFFWLLMGLSMVAGCQIPEQLSHCSPLHEKGS